MPHAPKRPHTLLLAGVLLLALPLLGLAGCGGGGGGPGPEGAGQGLILVSVSLADLDNVSINDVLEFTFSEPVDPSTVMVTDPSSPAFGRGRGSIQIRIGDAFGLTADGTFAVDGATVLFRPALPGRNLTPGAANPCDLSDAGFQPGATYRVIVMGAPEEFAITNTRGQPLDRTTTHEFTTLPDSDPDFLRDQRAGEVPRVVSSDPPSGAFAVAVEDTNEIRVRFSENIHPCSIDYESVRLFVYELGDPDTFEPAAGRESGFVPVEDNAPEDPYSWGSTNTLPPFGPPQRIPAAVRLVQSEDATELFLTPAPVGSPCSRFPENALIVLDLTNDILDFGENPLQAETIAFTTENVPPVQTCAYTLELEGETPIEEGLSTADINTPRSVSRAQGWFLFAGDGDNGFEMNMPAAPLPCVGQSNDGVLDDFDPDGNWVFDTGTTVNACDNEVDGSRAVVWEFNSLTLRSGRTISFVGNNPLLILVRGDVDIRNNATLRVRLSATGAWPRSDGEDWGWTGIGSSAPVTSRGGVGVAGGGAGGSSIWGNTNYGADGVAGAGSPDEYLAGGHGAGEGGVAVEKTTSPNGGTGGGGGGGGHAQSGQDGITDDSPDATHKAAPRSGGGEKYHAGSNAQRMLQPSAGSGGGGGGWLDPLWAGGASNAVSGGGGGAGGGFIGIACNGDMTIAGTIDASGGDGGNGVGLWNGSSFLARSGGGGGGSGGGILLLTPGELRLEGTATLTTSGGSGGRTSTTGPGPFGFGGSASQGRVVLEDGDSVVPGLSAAEVVPGPGQTGFFRGLFDPTRFVGSQDSVAVTAPFYVGVLAPTLLGPVTTDFVAGVPAAGAPGTGRTAILIEARGFPLLSEGGPDLAGATGWYTVGYFEDTGIPTAPRWVPAADPTDIAVSNDGTGIENINLLLGSSPYLQVRMTFILKTGANATDAGPYLDTWNIRYEHDQ